MMIDGQCMDQSRPMRAKHTVGQVGASAHLWFPVSLTEALSSAHLLTVFVALSPGPFRNYSLLLTPLILPHHIHHYQLISPHASLTSQGFQSWTPSVPQLLSLQKQPFISAFVPPSRQSGTRRCPSSWSRPAYPPSCLIFSLVPEPFFNIFLLYTLSTTLPVSFFLPA